jgi:hypothetical protein
MNKVMLLKIHLRRGDRTLVRQLVYQILGHELRVNRPCPEGSPFLEKHVVCMKARSGDMFAVTNASVGDVYKGLPVLSLRELKSLIELYHGT